MKKETGCKGKEADVHMIDKKLEGPRGVISAYTASNAQPYQQQVQPAQHLTKYSIRGEGPINPDIPRQNHGNSLRYPFHAYLLEKKLVTPIFVKPKDGLHLLGFDPS